jgi:hypothetical protein
MHALINNGAVEKYPYTIGNLRRDNPHTSFPKRPPDEMLEEWNMYVVARVDRPDVDPITQNISEQTPVLVNGQWTQVWAVTDATPEEIAERKKQQLEQAKAQRADAYRNEADPLFFKAQRNEAELTEWEAKVQEIRDRFPYPEEPALN